jgi:hypothetical protein
MRRTVILAVLITAGVLVACGTAGARQELMRTDRTPTDGLPWPNTTFFEDDMESMAPGWTHGDFTATAAPHFHVDTYMAYSGTYSWWCGNFDYDADGGYGNSWDDRLNVPNTDWSGYLYPVFSFYYRNDTEPAYDFTYVQAESSGAWVNLNRGFDGVHAWGAAGFYLGNKDNPAVCRFRFLSDGAWSDADGLYLSDGGAFMCDEVQIYDYYTGTPLFFDDVESGGLCVPDIPAAAGDYWHLLDNVCKAWSGSYSWACTSVDTPGIVPGLVQNWLRTPSVDISGAISCTTDFVIQFFVATVDNDYWTEEVTVDNGASWTQLHAWWGDQCDAGYSPCDHFAGGDDITNLLPGTRLAHRWTMYTTDNGIPTNVCNCAGITIDDVEFFGVHIDPVEPTTWGHIKAIYR